MTRPVIFAFSFLFLISSQSLFEFVFFYRCLDQIVYIVAFIIVLYLSIQLQSCQSVSINLLTYLLTYEGTVTCDVIRLTHKK